ncbi:hypothetical protein HD597_000393 [Nonomuraea thailandensis]|uniref:Peptidase inhibitor family I36 n=1 Tax=Nonomuraea thailandensis TaxID=1188745 RepID=A0A9X2GEW0_9ACTN|nr:peptidase inhibitor family I36 protein [Nonomuraea thailandensis]MCP2353373.1 hypothetical protein [Nonomuraea thailandensis]
MRTTTVAALAVLATALAALPAAPSQAAAGYAGCPDGTFCVYSGPNGTGRMTYYRTGSFNVAYQGLPEGGRSGFNNTTSKWCYSHMAGRITFLPGNIKVLEAGKKITNIAIWAVHRPDPLRCDPDRWA